MLKMKINNEINKYDENNEMKSFLGKETER